VERRESLGHPGVVGDLYPHGVQTSTQREAILDAEPTLLVLSADLVHHDALEVGANHAVFAFSG
jgi:hypothetical protein